MSLSYRIAPGVRLLPGSHALTPQGGRVVLDEPLVEALRAVDGCDLGAALDALRFSTPTPAAARATLACLAEAGLLERLGVPQARPGAAPPRPRKKPAGPLVSAVVVAYNGVRWLEDLLPSLAAQTWKPIEVVVVDNGSSDDTSAWVRREHPGVRLVRLDPGLSLAGGINRGVAEARGEHFFILNQDITLEPDAVAQLVAVAESDPSCGAVSAKLRLMRAPGFLNGLGNHVQGWSWGSDIAMGHLDLGQFDGWREVPSSCFAATFVPRRAWERVGEVDEGFPLYYEDSEWCYRARAHGLRVLLAPSAVAYHAFGGSGDDGEGLSPAKLARVAHGRLRFALKLLPAPEAWQFVSAYLAEDLRELRGPRPARPAPGRRRVRRRVGPHDRRPPGDRGRAPPAGRPEGQPDIDPGRPGPAASRRAPGGLLAPPHVERHRARLRPVDLLRKDAPHARGGRPAAPPAAPREPGRGGPPHGGPGPALPRDGARPLDETWTPFSPSRTERRWTCPGCTS